MPTRPTFPTILRTVAARTTGVALAARWPHHRRWCQQLGGLHQLEPTAVRPEPVEGLFNTRAAGRAVHERNATSHRVAALLCTGAVALRTSRGQRATETPLRHGLAAWTPLERVMRRAMQAAQAVVVSRAGAVTHQHHTRWSLTLAPQFVQRVQRHATTVHMAAMGRPATVVLRPVLRTLATTGAHGARRAAVVSASPQATALHASPAAARTALRPAASRHAVAATPFARLPLTLVRNAAGASSASQRPPQAAAATDVNAVQRSPQPAPWPLANALTPPLPAQEVQRLTDHVMAQLDRRALSWRERTQA